MAVYITEIDGKKFEVEIQDDGTQATFNGESFPFDSVWLDDRRESVNLLLGGRSYDLRIEEQNDHLLIAYAGQRYECRVVDKRLAELREKAGDGEGPKGRTIVKSPMPGLVVKVLASEGDEVKKGDRLLVVEAMKMENDVKAPRAGTVTKIAVKAGDPVEGGRELLVIE
jgi:biotin carboxyl carrier protein